MKNFNLGALNLNPAPKGGAKVGKNGALGSAKNVVKGGPVGMKPLGSVVGGSGGSGSSNGSALKKPSGAAKK
jgi:hypothetical protein